MAKVFKRVDEIIGNTPLLEVCNLEKAYNLYGKLLVKLEYLNPTGSAKDRAAKYMISDAKKRGILKAGSVIIEPTSPFSVVVLGKFRRFLLFPFLISFPNPRFPPYLLRKINARLGLFLLEKFFVYVIIMVLHGTL